MYLESHPEFATASVYRKAADGILCSSAFMFLNVKRMNGGQVDFYLAWRLFSAACCYRKYMAGFFKKSIGKKRAA